MMSDSMELDGVLNDGRRMLRASYDIDEDDGAGVFVGVNWAVADFACVGVEGNFYGDGNGISVGGGLSF